MKKLISLIGAGAMLLSLATPALARGGHRHESSLDVARVRTTTAVTALTGDVTVGNEVEKAHVSGELEIEDVHVSTGDAEATARVKVVANKNVSCGDRCSRDEGKDIARVRTTTDVYADSGLVTVGNSVERAGVSGDMEIEDVHVSTGDATARANVLEVVNVNW